MIELRFYFDPKCYRCGKYHPSEKVPGSDMFRIRTEYVRIGPKVSDEKFLQKECRENEKNRTSSMGLPKPGEKFSLLSREDLLSGMPRDPELIKQELKR